MKKVYLLSPVSAREMASYFRSLKAHEDGIEIMEKKAVFYAFRIKALSAPAANILKQEALAAGAELATAWSVIKDPGTLTDAILTGTYRQIEIVCAKIKDQQFGLPPVADELLAAIGCLFGRKTVLKYGDSVMEFGGGPRLMGVLNVTPDSFSDGGRFFSPEAAVEHGLELCEQGADMLDVGGESTRPGSEAVDAEEEKRRVVPVIRRLRERVKIPISIDTMKSEVAAGAMENGADIVNDVSAMGFDDRMPEVVRRYKAGVVLMHMQGTPKTMQQGPAYTDVMEEVLTYLDRRVRYATGMGIERDRIAVDPGIGFGKTVRHNLLLLKHVRAFKALGLPLLVGASRKSFVGKLADAGTDERVPGSLAAAVWAAAHGADILRVHDVRETRQALAIARSIMDA